MRSLIPADPSLPPAEFDLHGHYAHDWIEQGGVRANFVASIDGAATTAGLSRGLQTPGDNRVFAALRDLADVVLVGAATAQAESYSPARPSTERAATRQRYGLRPAPAIAVVSASLSVDLSTPLFRGADPEHPTLVVTGSSGPISRRTDIVDLASGPDLAPGSVALIDAGSTPNGDVDLVAAVAQLTELGYRRILCEGGPRLLGSATARGVVDELCLTVSPMLVGPGGSRIVAGPDWSADLLPQLRLVGLLEEDDALFCRYRIQR
ncbi:pyrimidine reductase family protein [Jatrophihabitans telluris]|uniref:Pyrimidine reductase family protein n=1 Tax=Jatrophihabitans telluris TaxID=2038343 RepID=A0ABY4QST7_9ACTN|nr:pyrimidine reductase family protein [Jatrophihabitans telluris]UQX86680.1 pyrimidine reductase family protein [Jatrophihabitans telluris]